MFHIEVTDINVIWAVCYVRKFFTMDFFFFFFFEEIDELPFEVHVK
jgi:hypothetical protein